jgi:hypothetical protein
MSTNIFKASNTGYSSRNYDSRQQGRFGSNNRDSSKYQPPRPVYNPPQEKKKEEFKMVETEYPDLLPGKPALSERKQPIMQTKTMNFATAALTEVKKAKEEDAVPPGWVRITQGKNRQLITEYGPSTYIEDDEKDLNDQMNEMIKNMQRRRDRYKEYYIENYGEDAYYKMYPEYSYSDDSESDDDQGYFDDY